MYAHCFLGPGSSAFSIQRIRCPAGCRVQRQEMTKSLTPPKRRWKYISYRAMGKRHGWVVQLRGCTIGGLHETQAAAARTLMNELGVKSVNDLPKWRSSAAQRSRSAFRGVSFHKQKVAFVVNDASTGRTYSSDRDAAAARSEALGASDDALKRSISPKALATRMRIMRRIYFPRRGPQLLMSDLDAAIRHVKLSACMYAAFPTTEGVSNQFKYGPWKDALLKAWIKKGKPKAIAVLDAEVSLDDAEVALESSNLLQDASVLRSLLVDVVVSINEKPVSKAWSSNCSRSVGRHSSPQMVLKHFGLLEAQGPLCFEQVNDDVQRSVGSWRLLTRPAEVTACTQKLAQFIIGWATIMAAISQAPRTCAQWKKTQEQAYASVKALPFSVPRLPTHGDHDYVAMWTVRTYMLTLMAKEGIHRLKIDPDMWTLAFCKMNPDENKHLFRMYRSFRPKSVKELLEVTGCSGLRPELFSMLACLCGDAGLDTVDFIDFSAAKVRQWQQKFMTYHRRKKVMCIPAVGCALV